MSANIDTMMYVGQTPWHGLGHRYEVAPTTSEEIITAAKLDWTVSASKMHTELHPEGVLGYHAIYRDDNNEVLGVVNDAYPRLVQNTETFNAFADILGKEVSVETAASLGRGGVVFGCFKINESYKLIDDDVDHYFVVMNDHLKTDGKITILNTPIRVVCQNTLSAALAAGSHKIRIPVVADTNMNAELARKVIESAGTCIAQLDNQANKMLKQKISKQYVETLLDELFPFVGDGSDESIHSKANERISMMRSTFVEKCMGASDLQNYAGTQYQVYNALTDFTQHYFANAEKAYDLQYRMKMIPGMGGSSETPAGLVSKYLKIKDKIVA